LGEIRRQFNIPQVVAWDDINEMLAPGEEIDWDMAREGVMIRLLGMPITVVGDRP
jgi:hypothetical protein